jgi:hypothetical protein
MVGTKYLSEEKLARWGIRGLLVIFILLGLSYMMNTPLFESADESNHLQVVNYMRTTRHLPPPVITDRRTVTGRDMAWSLAYHNPPLYYAPPLYHALGALLTCWMPMDDLRARLIPNPAWEAGYAPGLGADLTWNQNIYVHMPGETLWESSTVRAAMLLRVVSLLLGCVTVGCAYELAREIFHQVTSDVLASNDPSEVVVARGCHLPSLHKRDFLALGAAAWVALNPQFIDVSSGVTNDALLNALFSLALLGMLRRMRRASPSGPAWGRWAGLGALVGLGMLTKQSALILLPLGAVAILGQSYGQDATSYVGRGRSLVVPNPLVGMLQPAHVIEGLAFGGTALAVGGWWYLLNALRYGDPLGVAPHFSSQVPLAAFDVEALLMTFRSYWMGFGWGTPAPVWICIVVSVIIAAAIAGLGRALLPGGAMWDATVTVRRSLLLLVMALGLNVLGLVRWAIATGSPSGRLLFPTIAATGVLWAWGIAQWWHLRAFRWGLAILVGGLLIFDIGVPWLLKRPGFRSPYLPNGVAESVWEHGDPNRLDELFDGAVRLLGYGVQERMLHPGDTLKVTLYWRAEDVPRLYKVWSQLGPQDPTRYVVGEHRWLGGTLYPSALWRSGDTIKQTIPFHLPAWTPTPALYWVRLGLVDEQGARLMTEAGEDKVTLGPWRVRAGETPLPLEHQVDFRLGDAGAGGSGSQEHDSGALGEIQLVGYEIALRETLVVTLAWKSRAVVATDYVAFVHLLDGQGALVAQHDAPPAPGAGIVYPTSWWLPGDVILDRHTLSRPQGEGPDTLSISAALKSGILRLGLYDPVTLQRLPAYDAEGHRLLDDAIGLVEIEADAE